MLGWLRTGFRYPEQASADREERARARTSVQNPEHFTRGGNIRSKCWDRIEIESYNPARWNHVSPEEHSIITRPRGDFDACIGELVARLLVRVSTDARFIGRRVFIERPRVYETYVPSIRSLSFSLFFFFLEKVGLRPTRFFVLFYEYTVFKWTSISISTNLAFRLEVFGILDRWFLYLYSCLYLYILNNYAKRDIWSGDRIGIVEEFCGKKRWIQDF